MAYINGKNVLFGAQVNGILDGETTENADFGATMKKWLSLDIDDAEITETYDLILPDWVTDTTFNDCFLPNLHERIFKSNTLQSFTTSSMFSGCSKLETVFMPACKEISGNCFALCSSLTNVTLGVITEIENTAFRSCTAIKNVTIGQGSTAPLLNLYQSTKLTQASVEGIIDAYADMTSAGGAELRFAQNVYDAISEEYKQKATAKGLTLWQASVTTADATDADV